MLTPFAGALETTTYESPLYPVCYTEDWQRFALPHYVPAHYVKVTLLDKVQQEPWDDLYVPFLQCFRSHPTP